VRVSSKGEYGLRALVDLAVNGRGGQPVQVKDIARRQAMPEEYLGQLMVTLRRSGLVRSVRGAAGGYLLARPPDAITVADVVEVLEGPFSLVDEPAERGDRRSDPSISRAIREVWNEANRAAQAVLRGTTIQDIADRESAAAHTYHI
jgi:Rrf2 family protein